MKSVNHGDTAHTAKIKSINHGEHGAHGEKQKQEMLLPWVFSVLSVFSVVNAFELAFRRVAVVQSFP